MIDVLLPVLVSSPTLSRGVVVMYFVIIIDLEVATTHQPYNNGINKEQGHSSS